ncbi:MULTISPECIES: homoserine kinase [Corallococcus]|uniref:homoserine kinase n=1 Tax=Corallococcus TaxID=83461 RepID=UPI00117D2252|nr:MULTISPECIES: homoserine kinase [Corallococcus]NBD08575.1 phosphotransferase [Corallococcus silvisoli]TSC33173.1 homoserine kinase [Corallococcus sp. Z5C101001]
MAVYTTLPPEAFTRVADAYGLGAVHAVTPIPQGSINTNHRMETDAGRVFVRHTTVRSEDDLRFEASLLEHLSRAHFPAPVLLVPPGPEPFLALHGGRISVFKWLAGEELTRDRLTLDALERLGAELGKLHRVTLAFGGARPNPYGPEVVKGWLDGLTRRPEPELVAVAQELAGALSRAEAEHRGLEPRGVIHADLFLDNVKWLGDRVGAFFDFEMACVDAYALDVAITLNAWCFEGTYQPALCQALLRGYQDARPLADVEKQALYGHALYGAVRFTTSRIRDYHLSPLGADKLAPKDFRTYLARARALGEMGPDGFRALVGV